MIDTITIDDRFIEQLKLENNIKRKKVIFKMDSTKLYKYKETYSIYTNVLFYNKTKSVIFIKNVRGGSNYFAKDDSLVLLPNEKKTIKMSYLFYKIKNKLSRVLSFYINKPEEEKKRIYTKHIFDFTCN